MNTLECIKTRYSCRNFADKEISRETLEVLVDAAKHAPSGMNRQSFQFTVVSNKEKIAKLCAVVGEALEKANYNMYSPAALILCSDENENGNGLADCSCALQNIFLAAHELGVGSVWINQLKLICDKENVRAVLDEFGVPASHNVWGIAALGYDAGDHKAKERTAKVVFVD